MISVINPTGTSFKGLAAYLLHDLDQADTSERVAWTHTHNLATDDPEKAWRIMASTSMSQAEIKAAAGGSNAGKKSHHHVKHIVLSWSPTHDREITKDEMIDAAIASLTYIGAEEGERLGKKRVSPRRQYADEHQALIVCHDDGPDRPPHVHIMLNRVNPEHGVMVSDSMEREKLSAWAHDYRVSQGKEHLCPERVKNMAKRAHGLLTSHPRKPRNVYEQEKVIAEADPGSRKKALLEQQRRRAKELKHKTERLKRDQTKAVRALEEKHVAGERAERAKSAAAIRAARSKIKEAYAPKIDRLTQRHADEKEKFNEAKQTAAGRVRNTWEAFKTKEWMTEIRTRPLHAMKHGFTLAFDAGMQERDIDRHHSREQRELSGSIKREERDAAREIRSDESSRLGDLRKDFNTRRNDLYLTHDMGSAKLKAEWHQLTLDRRATTVEPEQSRSAKPSPSSDTSGLPSGAARQVTKSNIDRHGLPIDEIRATLDEIRGDDRLNDQKRDRGPERGE